MARQSKLTMEAEKRASVSAEQRQRRLTDKARSAYLIC